MEVKANNTNIYAMHKTNGQMGAHTMEKCK